MGRIGNVLTSVVNDNNNLSYNYEKVLKNSFGQNISDADVDNTIYIKVGSEYFKNTSPIYSIDMWGAKIQDPTFDNAPAFNAAAASLAKLAHKAICIIPSNEKIKMNSGWKINGGIEGTEGAAAYFIGTGARSTIFDFSGMPAPNPLDPETQYAIKFGNNSSDPATWANTLHGGLKGIGIKARPDIDALVIASYAPTSGAFNRFDDIYIKKCKDGIKFWANPTNESSNFQNIFTNIGIQGHYGVGVTNNGAYNTYKAMFIVGPGDTIASTTDTTTGFGASTAAIYDISGGSSWEDTRVEDQCIFNGGNTMVRNLAIEYITKAVASPLAGSNGIKIAGAGVVIDGLVMQGFKNTMIDQIGSIYSPNVSISNAVYLNPPTAAFPVIGAGDTAATSGGNPLFKIAYGFLPGVGSSGIMSNTDFWRNVTYDVYAAPFASAIEKWTMLQIAKSDGTYFCKLNGFSIPNLGDFLNTESTGSHTVKGFVDFVEPNGIQTTTLALKSAQYWYGSAPIYIQNAALDGFIGFFTRNPNAAVSLSSLQDLKFSVLPPDYADDAAAAASGTVDIGETYRTGNVLKIRIT